MMILGAQAGLAGKTSCKEDIRSCLLDDLKAAITKIDKQTWTDRALRDFAKVQAELGTVTPALKAAQKIDNPDTRAMALRGIAIAVAQSERYAPAQDTILAKISRQAKTMDHAPSRAIARTYIAKALAIAGHDRSAYETAAKIDNGDMRNKAYGAIAEAQARQGHTQAVITSLGKVDDAGYRNRQYKTTAKMLADKGDMKAARRLANAIEGNAVLRAGTLQALLNRISKKQDGVRK
jgi:hypothetical protein